MEGQKKCSIVSMITFNTLRLGTPKSVRHIALVLGCIGILVNLEHTVASIMLMLHSSYDPIQPTQPVHYNHDHNDDHHHRLMQSTGNHRSSLRLDWNDLPVISPLAKMIAASQTRECHPSINPGQKFRKHTIPKDGGLGSTIHTWSQSLCHAIGLDMILVTRGPWLWMSEDICGNIGEITPSMLLWYA
jgi:hypothetical protein